ncbi:MULTISPECIES: hypothetical protein [unclassified Novosphingobium]|uniref:hypothetical protein n=1 Tax=unclassified Novosphingobium TaxID=2644732 RepID=UPI0025F9329C|nr:MULTISPECIES: hypothetical protein [unclassified Novosphingobium]HQV04357.1 hypothetical protein [Novosphingobium sp.]
MNTDEQIIAAQQLDPVEAGRIIRQLGNIAPDYQLASGPISDRLMGEIVRKFTKAAVEPWIASEANGTAILMASEWKMTKGVGGIGDAWLELSEITTDDYDHSWLEAALKTGGTLMCVELKVRAGLSDAADKVIRDDKAVAGFFKLGGWTRDEQEARLFQPVDLLKELVAQAFEMNDFDEALKPVSQAVAAAIAAIADLDALINRIRDEAKKK